MASSLQRRCVFVGNIPYDATEEQLIDICREVGPVVSFRLVIDRETGKPKGYGFCEYKDEETALSARRNLQGYEINGRQLRVDFADNDKNADRNREQGRGGPGLAANSDFQKQVGGPAISGESAQHQPIGLHIAITAANVMAGALGGPQTGIQLNQAGLQGQSALASDPLTLHLAKMSRSQLLEIMSELKTMATQNKEAAHQLLLAKPQLSKAFFQAQIMLGMVTPQVLQMPNIRQPSGQSALPLLQDPRQGQQPAVQTVPMLPPFAQRPPLGLVSKVQETQLSAVPQSSLAQNQFSTVLQAPMQPQTQVPRHVGSRVLQQVTFPGNSGVPPLPPVQPSIRPQIPVSDSSSNPQMQPSIQRSMVHDSREPMNRPSKLQKLDDGRSGSFLLGSSGVPNAAGSGLPQAFAVSLVPANPLPRPEELQHAEKPLSQLPSDVESALLQQVLNLSPEQLSSLPPAQRQQVIQLQQALRRDQLQPS